VAAFAATAVVAAAEGLAAAVVAAADGLAAGVVPDVPLVGDSWTVVVAAPGVEFDAAADLDASPQPAKTSEATTRIHPNER